MEPRFAISDLRVGDVIVDKSERVPFYILVVRIISKPPHQNRFVLAHITPDNEILHVCGDVFTRTKGDQHTIVDSNSLVPSWWPKDPMVARNDKKLATSVLHIPTFYDIGLPDASIARKIILDHSSGDKVNPLIVQGVEMLSHAEELSVGYLGLLRLFGLELNEQQTALLMVILTTYERMQHGDSVDTATSSLRTDMATLPHTPSIL